MVWSKDPGANHYELKVYDAYGNEIWQDLSVPPSDQTVTRQYPGQPDAPELQPGMYYQFRVISISNQQAPISISEDLKGVFYLANP